jgi:hypothetical protein
LRHLTPSARSSSATATSTTATRFAASSTVIKDHHDAMANLGHSLTQLRLVAETVRSDLLRIQLTKEPTK